MATSKRPSYFERLRKGAGLAALAITFATVGIQGVILDLLPVKELQDAANLVQLLFRTAPLTLAFAVIAGLVVDQIESGNDDRWFWVVPGCALVLWVSTLLGNTLGGMQVHPAQVVREEGVVNPFLRGIYYLINMGTGYYRAYGHSTFWSSLILGIFLYWAVPMTLLHLQGGTAAGKQKPGGPRRFRLRKANRRQEEEPAPGSSESEA